MNAGQLDQLITFDTPSVVQAANGEETITWVPGVTVWAQVQPLTGREKLNADQVLADMDTRIRVRWSADMMAITPKHRIRHGSTILNIVSLANQYALGDALEIMCRSGTNTG
jgi:SPP1 family predicted phage head-tail adaptor